MNGMLKHLIFLCTSTIVGSVPAQEIQFIGDVESAMSYFADLSPRTVSLCVDSLMEDTVYVENIKTGELEMVVLENPLSRYEFFIDGALYRRIELIRDYSSRDTTWTEDLSTGDVFWIVQVIAKVIPNGAYLEFYPNGNIRIKGTLDGYNPDGTLKKTGTWMEWDADGNLIREEHYPPSPTRSSPSPVLPPR
jgi:antitoxin component YwqK of YwqJK toxin-antitoxin module